MALTNYTTFLATVENYLARTDLTSIIPDFIQLAQTRMSRDLRTEKMLKVATATITANDGTIGVPSDMLEVREIHLQGNPIVRVEYQSPDLFFKNELTTTSGISVLDRKSTRLNSSHSQQSRMPSSA